MHDGPRGLVAVDVPAPESDCPEFRTRVEERKRLLSESLAELNKKHYQLLSLRYGSGWTYKAIGVAMGMSEVAAKQMHDRVLDVLLTSLKHRNIRHSGDF